MLPPVAPFVSDTGGFGTESRLDEICSCADRDAITVRNTVGGALGRKIEADAGGQGSDDGFGGAFCARDSNIDNPGF
jgi:hypothetical protein